MTNEQLNALADHGAEISTALSAARGVVSQAIKSGTSPSIIAFALGIAAAEVVGLMVVSLAGDKDVQALKGLAGNISDDLFTDMKSRTDAYLDAFEVMRAEKAKVA